jgi:hypothetical protein
LSARVEEDSVYSHATNLGSSLELLCEGNAGRLNILRC